MTNDAVYAALIQHVSKPMSAFLRVCRSGGLSSQASSKILDAVEEAERLGYFAALVPAESARAARDMREALEKLILACDSGRRFERGVGGMTIEAQIRRTVINGVPAWAVEEARETLYAIPIPAAQPDQREAAMRSADEIRAEIERCKHAEDQANDRCDFARVADEQATIAALEWVLSPSKPQGPTR